MTRYNTHTRTHTYSQFHLQSNRGVSERSAPPSMQTYQEKKCHLLAHPASQWSPSSSSEWRTPAAQRQELPHRWTCTLHKTHHMALVTGARCHRDSSTNKKLPLNWHSFFKNLIVWTFQERRVVVGLCGGAFKKCSDSEVFWRFLASLLKKCRITVNRVYTF